MQLLSSGDYLAQNIGVKDGKKVLRFDLYASLINLN
jgi:hypothetical protein